MTDPIMQAFLEVERAMRHYNDVLEAQVLALRSSEASDASELVTVWTQGAKAMRDSSSIYLSYQSLSPMACRIAKSFIQEDLQG